MGFDKTVLLFVFVFVSLGFVFAITGDVVFGETSSEVTVDGFEILVNTYDGVTSNFSGQTEAVYRDFPGAILENTTYGKIEFQENLDLVTMGGTDNKVDFDFDLNISDNLIVVDEYSLPGIEKNVILSLYGLTFTDPDIYHNNVICSDCSLVSYSSGVLRFSVSSFEGVYYARESPVEDTCGNGVCESGEDSTSCPADCTVSDGGGGGGGGGGDTTTTENETLTPSGDYDFSVDPTLISIRMGKGTYYQQFINVTNNGTNEISIGVFVSNLEEFIFPDVRAINLQPGESRLVRLDIYVSNLNPADAYVGNVRFVSSHGTRETDIVLGVKEREALFDIRTEVLKKYINPGGRVWANISLINMGDLRNFDVNLLYKIIDFDRNEYTIKEEQFAINTTFSREFYLEVPEDIPIGNYLFYSQVYYGNINATSFDTFTTEKVSYLAWIVLIVVVLVLMFLAIRWYRHKIYSGTGEKKKNEKESSKAISGLRRVPVKAPKLD